MRNQFAWLGLLCLLALGCRSKTETATPEKSGLQPVTLALNWYPEAEHGGFYAALAHGYYREEGLDVTIIPGGPKGPVVQNVAGGRATFGVDNADKILLGRVQDAEVVAVMAPLQTSPRCILVHAAAGIMSFDDLRKLERLGISGGQAFAQYLQKHVNLDGVKIVPYPGNVAEFLLDKNYGQQAYSFSEPYVAEKEGSDPQCLMVSELGFNPYTSVLITSGETIRQQPELVARMVRASVRGWRKYLNEPDETNRAIHEQNPQMDLDILAYGVNALRPLCLPDGLPDERLGQMTAERWQTLADQLLEIEAVKRREPLNVDVAFTTEFLKPRKTRNDTNE